MAIQSAQINIFQPRAERHFNEACCPFGPWRSRRIFTKKYKTRFSYQGLLFRTVIKNLVMSAKWIRS